MSDYQPRASYNKYMQPEIMSNIFERLPIEAVVTCKCVCKTWLGIIEDPYFVERQRCFSMKQPPRVLVHPNYVIPECRTSPPDENPLYLVDFETPKARPLRVSPVLDLLGPDLLVTSTCDGLICIAAELRESPVYVYNPILDRLVKLPSNGMKRKLISHQVGILRHESSGSYKVLRACQYTLRGQENMHKFEMITLGEAAWMELTPPPLIYECNIGRPLEWRGAVHWKIQSALTAHSPQCIMSFDIDTNTFQIVNFMDDPPEDRGLPLLVIEDELVVLDSENSSLKLWKVIGSAVGEYSMDQYNLMETNVQWDDFTDCEWMAETRRDGVYLLHRTSCTYSFQRTSKLIEFSPQTGICTQLNLPGMPTNFTTFSFKPTLVSPLRPRVNAQ